MAGPRGEQGPLGVPGPIGPIGEKGIQGVTVFGPPGEDGRSGEYFNLLWIHTKILLYYWNISSFNEEQIDNKLYLLVLYDTN